MVSLPRKRLRAKAYPASESRMRIPIVTAVATSRLLRIQSWNGCSFQIFE